MEIERLRKSHEKHITLTNSEWERTMGLRNLVGHEFSTQGYLTLQTFNKVLDWKLRQQRKRTEKLRIENTADLIRELTGTFWRVKHNAPDKVVEIKLGVLMSIPGTGIGVASALLTLSDPANFAIIDFRNWKVLYSEDKRHFTVPEYKKYLADVRQLAEQLDCDVQEVDFLLWKEFEDL
jgi:thermostable 8-oxoguanine DNA glycosylase